MTYSPPAPHHKALLAKRRQWQEPDFLFVRFEDQKKAMTRSQLRSHAMLASIRDRKKHSHRRNGKHGSLHHDAGSYRGHYSDSSTASDDWELEQNAMTRATIWDSFVNQVDPFDVLPIPGVGEVVRAYMNNYPGVTPLSDDKLIVNRNETGRSPQWDNTMWSLLSSNEATFAVLLYGTNLVRDSIWKQGISRETAMYLGRVMKAVRENMPTQNGEEHISQEYVVAVAGLAAGASVTGNWGAAANHLNGLLALIRARGGFHTFKRFAQRTIMWCEFYVRSTQISLPALRRDMSEVHQHKIPREFQDCVSKLHEKTISYVPQLLSTEISWVMRGLHFVSLAQKLPWEKIVDRVALSDTLDDTAYRLIAERVRLEENEDCQQDTTYAAVTEAAGIFLWGALGEVLGRKYAMNGLFGRRLKRMLSAQPLYSTWKDGASVALFWVLFMGWNFSTGTDDEISDWFEEWLFALLMRFNVETEAELRSTLGEFPWTDGFCNEPCRLLWDRYATYQDTVSHLSGSLF